MTQHALVPRVFTPPSIYPFYAASHLYVPYSFCTRLSCIPFKPLLLCFVNERVPTRAYVYTMRMPAQLRMQQLVTILETLRSEQQVWYTACPAQPLPTRHAWPTY